MARIDRGLRALIVALAVVNVLFVSYWTVNMHESRNTNHATSQKWKGDLAKPAADVAPATDRWVRLMEGCVGTIEGVLIDHPGLDELRIHSREFVNYVNTLR